MDTKTLYEKFTKLCEIYGVYDCHEKIIKNDKLTDEECTKLMEFLITGKINGERQVGSYYYAPGYANMEYYGKLLEYFANRKIIITTNTLTVFLNILVKMKGGEKYDMSWIGTMMKNGLKLTKSQKEKLYKLGKEFGTKEEKAEMTQYKFDGLVSSDNFFKMTISDISKILENKKIKITNDILHKIHSRLTVKRCKFYLKFIKKFGNNGFELTKDSLENLIFCCGWEKEKNKPFYDAIYFYMKHMENPPTCLDLILNVCEVDWNIINYLTEHKLFDNNIKGNEFELIASLMIKKTSDVIKFMKYFDISPKNKRLFDACCILNFDTLINVFIKNKNIPLTQENFDIACKSGNNDLVNYLLRKNICVSEKNIIDYALSIRLMYQAKYWDDECENNKYDGNDEDDMDNGKRRLTITDQFKLEVGLINKLITLTKISTSTKFMLMMDKLMNSDEEYKTFMSNVNCMYEYEGKHTNPNGGVLHKPTKKLNQKEFEIELSCSKLHEILRMKNDNMKINDECFCLSINNMNHEVLNYFEYEYKFVPTIQQVLLCFDSDKRIYLFNKYFGKN